MWKKDTRNMKDGLRELHGEPVLSFRSRKHILLFQVLVTDTALCHYLRPCSLIPPYFFCVCFLFCRGSPGREATDWPDKSSVKSERECYPVSKRKSRSGWILFVLSLTCLWFICWFIYWVNIKRVHVYSVSYFVLGTRSVTMNEKDKLPWGTSISAPD